MAQSDINLQTDLSGGVLTVDGTTDLLVQGGPPEIIFYANTIIVPPRLTTVVAESREN